MYTYNLCEFDYGYTGQFYQRSDAYGNPSYVDLDGNEIQLTGIYGYRIIEVNVTPSWT
jgi:hypothetical protein